MQSNDPQWLQKLEYELHRESSAATHTLAASQLLSSIEVGHIMQVSARTVQRWARNKALPHFRVGKTLRFRLDAVLEYAQVR